MITQEELDFALSGDRIEYPDDCQRIMKVAAKHGLTMSMLAAQRVWEHHSEMFCAGWLMIDRTDHGDKEIVDAINSYVREKLHK
jgi:hypothetical protein